ncbi:MAG: DUF177 domain-containing protein [Candidatus Kapabacteria bacterium]|jgi:uncharacterized metal-binding protein YceD (DUF177 family)|nr:DUF177 domain-containing protein [Candidatus Kapabacteria bacterium]
MIEIYIQGIEDDSRDIEIKTTAEEIEDMSPEFFGEVSVSGNLRKFGKRYAIKCRAECKAHLICDISGKEFEKLISADITLGMTADNAMLDLMSDEDGNQEDKENRVISEFAKSIDITKDIRDSLTVAIPMKKIAPGYENKSFEELHPELSAKANKSDTKEKENLDPRWSALKNIKIK